MDRAKLGAAFSDIKRQVECDRMADDKALYSLFMDVAPKLKKERELLQSFINCHGHTMIISSASETMSSQKTMMDEIVRRMVNDEMRTTDVSRIMCDCFWNAVHDMPNHTFWASESGANVRPEPPLMLEQETAKDLHNKRLDNTSEISAHHHTQQSVDESKNTPSTEQKNSGKISATRPIQGNAYVGHAAGNKNTNVKKRRNKALPIIGAVFGAAIVLCAVLLIGHKLDNSGANRGDVSQTTDVEFENLLAQETTEKIHDIYINDFDGNGEAEAFATTTDLDDSDCDNLWYISNQGATLVDEVGEVPQLLYTESGEILVPWRARYGATLCYGLYHGQVKKLDIYVANIFQKEEKGTIYAVEEYFTAEGEYHKNIACEFDPASFELTLTDEFYESNPEEDEDFCWNKVTHENLNQSGTDSNLQDEIERNRAADELFQDSDLYQIALASIPGTIQEWCYEDFDGDGVKEAFISTGDDDTYYTEDGEKSLWYMSHTGNIECILDNEAYWYFVGVTFSFPDCKLLYVDGRHGYYAVLGVENDAPAEVSMPENTDFYWISQDPESGIVTAAEKREERAHVLEYDSSSMSFVDTGNTVLSD